MEVIYVSVALSLLGAFATPGASQGMNLSFPIVYEAKILESIGQCPSTSERDVTFTEIKAEIQKTTQDYVIPLIQNVPIEPTVPPYSPSYCGEDASLWTQVAYFNMTDTSYDCPEGLLLYEEPRRSCGRGSSVKTCLSTSFSVSGQSYTSVCGRIIGYQVGPTTAFYASTNDIDSRYISGVSLTYGSSPRQHIWSFAGALGHSYSYEWNCPCTSIGYTSTASVPSFVGDSYFCETATDSYIYDFFYSDNPLWDGKGCRDTSTCCDFNNPPWFRQNLTEPTTEDIEMRLCHNQSPTELEDTPLELIELYIK